MVTTGDPTAIGRGDVARFLGPATRGRKAKPGIQLGMGQKPMKFPHDWGNTQPLTS
jgi:hypothetical protein